MNDSNCGEEKTAPEMQRDTLMFSLNKFVGGLNRCGAVTYQLKTDDIVVARVAKHSLCSQFVVMRYLSR